MRILIVGAGPTGLTAAVELARRGLVADLIERREGPSSLSRAVGIQAGSMARLAPSGAARAIDAEAVRFAGVLVHDGARPIARLPLGFDDRSRLWGLAQDRTEHHLAAALHRLGGTVRYGAPLEALSQDSTGVTVSVAGREARYDHVIGADGVRSTVRAAAGLEFPGHDLAVPWSIADVEADGWADPDWFKGYLLPGGDICVAVPLEPARFRLIASRPDALAALPVGLPGARVRRSGSFTIRVRQVARYSLGRVHLAGDAAHCHSPVGGRGMNLGIADAVDLARCLSEGGIDRYHALRHPEGRRVIALSERGRRMLQSPARRPLVTAALRGIGAVPPLARAAARALAGG